MAWAAACHDVRPLVEQVASLLAGHFRMALSRGLAAAARRWASGGAAEEADRLAPIVEALSQRRAWAGESDASSVGKCWGAGVRVLGLAYGWLCC